MRTFREEALQKLNGASLRDRLLGEPDHVGLRDAVRELRREHDALDLGEARRQVIREEQEHTHRERTIDLKNAISSALYSVANFAGSSCIVLTWEKRAKVSQVVRRESERIRLTRTSMPCPDSWSRVVLMSSPQRARPGSILAMNVLSGSGPSTVGEQKREVNLPIKTAWRPSRSVREPTHPCTA